MPLHIIRLSFQWIILAARKHSQTAYYSVPSRKTSFVIGRTNTESFVRSFALLTRPSRPVLISNNLPKGQWPRGRLSSTINTTSPICKLGFTFNHLGLICSSCKYSRVHLCQNCSAICWTWRHFLRYLSLSSNLPHANDGFCMSNNMWFGVSASQ